MGFQKQYLDWRCWVLRFNKRNKVYRATILTIMALKHKDLSQYLQFSLLQPHLETKVDRRRTQEIEVKLLLP